MPPLEGDARQVIYLASPYGHPQHWVRVKRARLAARATAHFIARGHQVISPIAHGHAVSLEDIEELITADQWYDYGFRLLEQCNELWVLRLSGWQHSIGVQAEIKLAADKGLPRKDIDPVDIGIKEEFSARANGQIRI
ncbi:MAG: DUF1937 family protein [Pseudomonadota bacterium]